MIAYLKGTVTEVDKDSIILECRNIGYRIFMPGSVLERMGRTGEERIIHTYLNIREDAMQLYGFLTKNDLSVFRLLLGVSGIGPKAAMGILSYFSWEAVEALVALGYGRTEALKAVRQVSAGGDMDVEDLLRAALKQMV